jgi:hypothetical protein
LKAAHFHSSDQPSLTATTLQPNITNNQHKWQQVKHQSQTYSTNFKLDYKTNPKLGFHKLIKKTTKLEAKNPIFHPQ